MILAELKAAAAGDETSASRMPPPVVHHHSGSLFTSRRKGKTALVLELALNAEVEHEDFVAAFSGDLAQARAR